MTAPSSDGNVINFTINENDDSMIGVEDEIVLTALSPMNIPNERSVTIRYEGLCSQEQEPYEWSWPSTTEDSIVH